MLKVQEYRPQAFTDFTKEENVQAYQAALKKVRAELVGKHYPLVIDGERVDTAEKLTSLNPCDTSEVVGTTAKATVEDAERACRARGRRSSRGRSGTWMPAPASC